MYIITFFDKEKGDYNYFLTDVCCLYGDIDYLKNIGDKQIHRIFKIEKEVIVFN